VTWFWLDISRTAGGGGGWNESFAVAACRVCARDGAHRRSVSFRRHEAHGPWGGRGQGAGWGGGGGAPWGRGGPGRGPVGPGRRGRSGATRVRTPGTPPEGAMRTWGMDPNPNPNPSSNKNPPPPLHPSAPALFPLPLPLTPPPLVPSAPSLPCPPDSFKKRVAAGSWPPVSGKASYGVSEAPQPLWGGKLNAVDMPPGCRLEAPTGWTVPLLTPGAHTFPPEGWHTDHRGRTCSIFVPAEGRRVEVIGGGVPQRTAGGRGRGGGNSVCLGVSWVCFPTLHQGSRRGSSAKNCKGSERGENPPAVTRGEWEVRE